MGWGWGLQKEQDIRELAKKEAKLIFQHQIVDLVEHPLNMHQSQAKHCRRTDKSMLL